MPMFRCGIRWHTFCLFTLKPVMYLRTLLFLLLPCYSYGQDNVAYSERLRVLLKITPTNIISSSEAMLPLGVEFKIPYSIVGVGVEFGLPLMFNTLNGYASGKAYGDKQLKRDFRLRGDVRWYYSKDSKWNGYLGGDIWYRRQNFEMNKGQYYYSHSNIVYFNHADVEKSVFAINAITGVQAPISKRISLELQGGIGIAFLTVMRRNVTGRDTTNYYSTLTHWAVGAGEDEITRDGMTISLPWAIRLCYKL